MRTSVAAWHTRCLAMRPIARTDLPSMTTLFSLPAVVAHRPDPRPDSATVTAERLEHDIAHWARNGFGRWAIIATGTTIGFGGLNLRSDVEGMNLSYHLHPDYWGQGFASEFVAGATAIGFSQLGARRVVGMVRAANPRSERVLVRAGFRFEATIDLHGAPTRVLARYRPDGPGPIG